MSHTIRIVGMTYRTRSGAWTNAILFVLDENVYLSRKIHFVTFNHKYLSVIFFKYKRI